VRRALAALAAVAAACAPRPPLLDRAIAARGGPLPALVREVDAEVERGFPGTWRWRTVQATPDRWAWSLTTADQPNHYLFDGRVVRAFVGDALVSEDATPTAPLRVQARFMAVVGLDALRLPGVVVTPVDSATLAVVFPDRGDRYTVAFDAAALVVRVEGPGDFSPFATGRLVATFDDVRAVAGYRLAHRVRYALDGEPLAVERVRRACPLPGGLPDSAFAAPRALPACGDGARTP
jgi:hypothetical protein